MDTIRPAENGLDRSISKAQAKSSVPSITLLSITVTFVISGICLTLLFYLFFIHTTRLEGPAIVSTARLQLVTAMTQALSTCVTRAIPLIVFIYAYSIAAEWLTMSQSGDVPERPTALHLGLIMNVVQGASLISWITTVAHVARLNKRPSLAVPGILRRPIWVVGSLLLLSYLTSMFDTWLHITSTATLTLSEEPYASEDVLFGKQINQTQCDYSDLDSDASEPFQSLCNLLQTLSPYEYDLSTATGEASRTLGNSSTSNFVQLTDDQHAILVPATIPARLAYNASTIGVKSQCRSLTRQCLDSSAMAGAFPSFHCPGISVNNALLEMIPDATGVIFGVLNATGGISASSTDQFSFQAAITNPFQLVTVQMSEAFPIPDESRNFFIGDSGFFYTNPQASSAYNMLICDVAVKEVAYEYRDISQAESSTPVPRFTVQSYRLSDLRTTQMLAAMIDSSLVNIAVASRSLGAGVSPGSIFEDTFARSLSVSLIAAGASIFEEAPASSAISLNLVLVSRIRLIPLIGFGITVALLCSLTIALSAKSLHSARSTPLTHLGQMSIVSPQATLCHFVPRVDFEATWRDKGHNLFEHEREADGLLIGFYPSTGGKSSFGIGRAPAMWRRVNSSVDITLGSSCHSSSETLDQGSKPLAAVGEQYRNLPCGIFLITLASLALIMSSTIFLVGYVLTNQSFRSGGTLCTSASLSYILAGSQFITTVMSLAIGPTMALHAFRVAAFWADGTRGSEGFLPSELCRLFYTIQGASLWSFARQQCMGLRKGGVQGHQRQRLRILRMTSESIWLLGCLLLVSNLAAFTDNWFHFSSYAFPTNSYSQSQPSNSTLFGKQLDNPRCLQYATSLSSDQAPLGQLCGALSDDGTVSPGSFMEAEQTWANISTTNRVAMTQDQRAILVPADLPSDLRYQATTLGVQATCESITRRCVDNASKQNQERWAVAGLPWFNCPGSPPININNTLLENWPWPNLFGIWNRTTGDIVDGTTTRAYEVAKESPLEMIMAAVSYGGGEPGHNTSYFTDDGFTYMSGVLEGRQLLHCTVAIHDVQYEYDPRNSTFITLSTKEVAPQTIKMVMASTDNKEISSLVAGVLQVLYSSNNYTAGYARQLSTFLVSNSAFAYAAIEAEKVWRIESKLGSQLNVVPLAIFLGCSGLFCVILIVTILVTPLPYQNASPLARQAHYRLMSPLPVIMQLFGPVEALELPEGSESRRLLEEGDETRLNVGPLATASGSIFSVYKTSNREGHYSPDGLWASKWRTLPAQELESYSHSKYHSTSSNAHHNADRSSIDSFCAPTTWQ